MNSVQKLFWAFDNTPKCIVKSKQSSVFYNSLKFYFVDGLHKADRYLLERTPKVDEFALLSQNRGAAKDRACHFINKL
jgi:hypothetical protein